MTKDTKTPTTSPARTPGSAVPKDNPDEMSKMNEFRTIEKNGAKKHGQDPEEVAERMGTTGKEQLGLKK